MPSLLSRIKRKILAAMECLWYAALPVRDKREFAVISCERNAGDFALQCLDSVYQQDYDRSKVKHIFIDDASDDGTHEKIRDWLLQHPDHSVLYLHNSSRMGGTFNTVAGMRMAPEDAIVVELNGDDWLPDRHLLGFFNRVYSDDDIWMTYNTFRNINGPPSSCAKRFPRSVVRNNAFRDQHNWQASHLHTFRRRLFDHVGEDTFRDPETGQYWECADDQALYLSMLELSGFHSRHINRITCIYNYWESSHVVTDSQKSIATAERIRKLPRREPLPYL